MGSMTIGKLAAMGEVGVETVRFYQRRGLLPVPERGGGGVRRYDPSDLARLRFIRSAQKAGFTLEEIRELLALDAGTDHARARQLAEARLEAIDARLAELSAARASLARLAEQCAAGGNEPCPILTAFEKV